VVVQGAVAIALQQTKHAVGGESGPGDGAATGAGADATAPGPADAEAIAAAGAAAGAATGAAADGRTDAALVAAALRGDRAAFARLYERYARVVHGAVIARVPAQDADDLTQDVFVVALRRLWMLKQGESVGGWLLAIARARAADYWRQAAPRGELSDTDAAQPEQAAPAADATRVLAALRGLPDAYREVLAMRLIEGLNGPEIAERSGLTPGSVRVNLHRGMKLLRKKLGWKETP
jgi:RNA polymerase sigma-70 factor, ECF subfamily